MAPHHALQQAETHDSPMASAAASPTQTSASGDAARQDADAAFKEMYAQHASFVCRTLRRFGVLPADLDDLVHDVFLVVFRRWHTFDGASRATTWLFAVCRRVASNYRRRLRWLLESPDDDRVAANPSPLLAADELLMRRQERVIAERVLAKLQLEKRNVFVMFELETLSCPDIAKIMKIPVGTVYSRLHAARQQVQDIVARNLRAA